MVLEWTNHDCPYVVKHYNSGNMQTLQKEVTAKDVVWLSIISSKPGKQGHVSGQQANDLTISRNAAPTAVILDETSVEKEDFSSSKQSESPYSQDEEKEIMDQLRALGYVE